MVGTVAVVVCVRSTGPSLCLRREGTRECLSKLAGFEGKSCFMFRSVLWEREVSSLRRTPNFFVLEGG